MEIRKGCMLYVHTEPLFKEAEPLSPQIKKTSGWYDREAGTLIVPLRLSSATCNFLNLAEEK
jgi:hypothetical protein